LLSRLLLLQAVLSLLLCLLKMLREIDRPHLIAPHGLKLRLGHLVHPTLHADWNSAILLCQHRLTSNLLLSLMGYHLLLLLHLLLKLRIVRDYN
jgi:hypothetical protein